MAKYTDKTITFNNVKIYGTTITSSPIGQKNNYTYEDEDEEIINLVDKKVINAIDIDWNGAVVGLDENENDIEINSTSDLINYIKGAYSSGGDPSQSDFTPTEITALKGLVNKESEEDTLTYILKLEARVVALENALKTSSSDSTLLNVAAIKTNADKLQSIDGTKLKNTVDLAIRLTKLSNGQVIVRLANNTNNLGSLSNGPLASIDYVTNAISGKLDESAINYDSASQTLTITK